MYIIYIYNITYIYIYIIYNIIYIYIFTQIHNYTYNIEKHIRVSVSLDRVFGGSAASAKFVGLYSPVQVYMESPTYGGFPK